MKAMIQILLLCSVIVSCSSARSKNLKKYGHAYTVLAQAFINKADLMSYLNNLEDSSSFSLDQRAIKIARGHIQNHDYNEVLVSHARSEANYNDFEKSQLDIADSPLWRKIELLRMKEINPLEFKEYIADFNSNKNAAQRLDIVEQIINNDFPNHAGADFLSMFAMKLIRSDSIFRSENTYKNMKSNIKATILKLNLYLLKKIPTSDLEEVLKNQKSTDYTQGRAFIEKAQRSASAEYLASLAKELKRHGVK